MNIHIHTLYAIICKWCIVLPVYGDGTVILLTMVLMASMMMLLPATVELRSEANEHAIIIVVMADENNI